jgi:hypothetical protein
MRATRLRTTRKQLQQSAQDGNSRFTKTRSAGNEQAHRNVKRDGVGLTLLGGIMRGFHYDENLTAKSGHF